MIEDDYRRLIYIMRIIGILILLFTIYGIIMAIINEVSILGAIVGIIVGLCCLSGAYFAERSLSEKDTENSTENSENI